MKSKWVIFGILLAIGMVLGGPQNAQADTWATCSVDQVGQDSDLSTVKLTDTAAIPTFTNQWFKLRAASSKQMLAVALTALSLGKNVTVLIAASDGVTLNSIKVDN